MGNRKMSILGVIIAFLVVGCNVFDHSWAWIPPDFQDSTKNRDSGGKTTDDGNIKAPDLFETLHITLFVDLGMLFLAPHVSELRSLSRGLKHLCLLAGNAMSGF